MPEVFDRPIFWVLIAGFALTFVFEALLVPRPRLSRPLRAYALHAGVWGLALAVLFGITGRAWFSGINVLCIWLLIVLVSNAKYHSLREPFVCADFEYFSDAVKFPRLYLPFFGIGKAIGLAVAFVVYVGCGLYFEAKDPQALGTSAVMILASAALLLAGHWRYLVPTFDASADLQRWGLIASLWTYFRAARQPVDIAALGSPFATAAQNAPGAPLPDLVSVQSESFFDARRLWPGVRQETLSTFDQLRGEALQHGRLRVAAWGANTVRTEFSFLCGLQGDRLGVHRFNPYRLLARKGLPSIAACMKQRGYRTLCIHPYAGGFYGRDRVLPALGFDEFIDVRAFDDSQKAGPFIGDCAVAEKVIALLEDPQRTQPLYIHVVTMENHGPLHLEQVAETELPTWFDRPLEPGLRDLAPYLRHLANADRMLAQLRTALLAAPRTTGLCFYGDHVPILPDVYKALGEPDGDTEYFIWSNRAKTSTPAQPLPVEQLGRQFVDSFEVPVANLASHARVS